MLAKEWLDNVRKIQDTIQETQMEHIRRAASVDRKSVV